MIKIAVMLVSFSACLMTGIIIKSRFHRKEKMLGQFISFCESLKTQISFLQTNLDRLIEIEIGKSRDDFKKLLECYLRELRGEAKFEKPKMLDEQEWEIMRNLFNGLGKSDIKNQVALCENSKQAIMQNFETARQKNKTEGSMWLKLMFCLGFVSIIVFV